MSDPDRELAAPTSVRLSQDDLREVELFRQANRLMGNEPPTMSQALRALIVLGLKSFKDEQKRAKHRER